jgi:hypothetical protein
MDGGGYRRIDLPVTQPNGSRFILLVPSHDEGKSQDAAPLRFGASYESTLPEFTMSGSQLVVKITFRRTGPPIRSETIFFHVLDDAGNIIGNLDRAFCQQCLDASKVESREQRFLITPEMLTRAKRIGFGLYSATGPRLLLDAHGGPTDWDGRRILVEIPTNIRDDVPNSR